ncbi:MAG TPA: hypothetical protein VJK71_03235 [Gemmatimonadales bacterium]|nr:hypothetical protein [Gemmatimonadales bacterium]
MSARSAGWLALAGLLAAAPGSAQQLVSNTARAAYQTTVGPDSVISNPVHTTVIRPVATLQINLLSAGTARPGETVQYRIAYGNASAATISGVVLTDTLPTGLELRSATPAPSVQGRVLQWVLGDLAPSTSGEVLLTLAVAASLRDTLRVRNAVTLASSNADPQVALASEVELLGSGARAIALTLTADLLEVSLGETAPFTLGVSNSGAGPLDAVAVRLLLPDGVRYVSGSATGADSARATARDLVFYLAGPLAPDMTALIRFTVAVGSAASATLSSTAYAATSDGTVRSPDAVAWLRVRTAAPMENRAVIGRVWVDLDGNGLLSEGEAGPDGLEIWTDDGEIATTDATGRFSFRNIRPGRHGFRLDPASVPAEFRIAGDRDLVTLDASGWTTPVVNFRLLPRGGRLRSVGMIPREAPGPSVLRAAIGTSPGQLPVTDSLPPGSVVALLLEPPAPGWPGEATFPLPPGWNPSPGQIPAPMVIRDRSGKPVVWWRRVEAPGEPIVLRLEPAASAALVETVRLPAARPAESRARERSRAFLDGPGVEFFAPQDGAILPSDRLFVGVRGEPSTPIALFDGDSLLSRAVLRIDGVHDFIGVALRPGPHRLRIRMENSWGQERWDTLALHVTGRPTRFAGPGGGAPASLVADGNTIATVSIRVLDGWGVPVVNQPAITVAAKGATPVNPDGDGSSVGLQVTADPAGWLAIHLRPGRTVSKGWLRLSYGTVRDEIGLDVLPATQPLLVAAVGRIGAGASPDGSGAVTIRGRLDQRTSVTMSYDSRRLDAGRDAFGRVADPLEQAQYPILGDASAQRTVSASRYRFAARVERGFDWLALGDLSTASFGNELRLSGYRRALPGVAGRVTTGPVTWEGFGSSTSQTLEQLQLRGAGISGPYQLAANVRLGTEQVAVEIRAEANAARVLSREVLDRFVDYQIDYETGALLLKRPVPAADGYGNPVFIVVLYEAESGGPRSDVWGVRAALDGNRLFPTPLLDSLRIGSTWVQESPGAGDHRLVGADLHLALTETFLLSAEISRSEGRDSSGVAASVDAGVALLQGKARLSGSWLKTGAEYRNPANLAIQSGVEELRLGAHLTVAARKLSLSHERQRFETLGITRSHTTGGILQSFGSRVQLEASLTDDRFSAQTGGLPEASLAGELALHWKPDSRWTLSAEARRQFQSGGSLARPDYLGARASFDLSRAIALELRQRIVFLPGDSVRYSVTDLGVRTRVAPGTEAYGSYQIAGVEGGRNAALIGLRNQLRVGDAITLNALFERRSGIDRASNYDPVRAAPFLQVEEDYWSAAVGAELLPAQAPYRLSARGEYRDGNLRSTRLVTVAGDLSLSRSLALLSRNELLRNEPKGSALEPPGHRYSTLWGLAVRPVTSGALNLLARFEAIDADNPLGGGVLTGSRAEGRTILAAEAIWQPGSRLELAGRYAYRRATSLLASSGVAPQELLSEAGFLGWRASVQVAPLLMLRAEGRLLAEYRSGSRRYDVAPQLVLLPQRTLEIAAGYRAGNLRDPDFAVNGGPGWFVTFGIRVTEQTFASAAEFWRERIAGGQ